MRGIVLSLTPGDKIRRTELHAEYGGRRQGGISPSKVSDNVFLITAPSIGERHGYVYDGPREDGYYHYTGEGQYGDQLMVQGNERSVIMPPNVATYNSSAQSGQVDLHRPVRLCRRLYGRRPRDKQWPLAQRHRLSPSATPRHFTGP